MKNQSSHFIFKDFKHGEKAMEIQIKNNKVLVKDNNYNYQFDLVEIMKFALIENDKSRKGQVFRSVARHFYNNDMKCNREISGNKFKGEKYE